MPLSPQTAGARNGRGQVFIEACVCISLLVCLAVFAASAFRKEYRLYRRSLGGYLPVPGASVRTPSH